MGNAGLDLVAVVAVHGMSVRIKARVVKGPSGRRLGRRSRAGRRDFEWIKHFLNKSAIYSGIGYWVLMFVGILISEALDLMRHEFPWPMIPGMLCGVVLALCLIPLFFINLWDWKDRRKFDETCGVLALMLLSGGWCSAGLGTFIYYRRWARHPLEPPPKKTLEKD
jgi:hypothetical protein